MKPALPLLLTLATGLLTACTWVQLTSQGQGVRLLAAAEVGRCERLGTTTSTTRSRIWIADRGSDKVQDELITLARNEAGSLGGNAIVVDGAIEDGQQRYIVYRCP